MKAPYKIFLYTSLIILFWACSGEPEPNLELFSPEAFAYDVGDSWEVNASINVKGFAIDENESKPEIKLYYKINLITPQNDTIKSIFNKDVIIDVDDKENRDDVPLEAQIELDSSFTEGQYELMFYVSDEISKQSKTVTTPFLLE